MTPPTTLLDQLPVGITVVDLEGRILYYNDTCARLVDRKPDDIGRDIRSCHKKSESVAAIDRMLDDIHSGRKKRVYYETERKGRTLAVTISTYEVDGKLAGTIQSIIVRHP
jgi:PAS domain S-box-containing protein